MRKQFLFLISFLSLMLGYSTSAWARVNFVESEGVVAKALRIPAPSNGNHYQFRFDDKVLGSHTNGQNNGWNNGIVNKGDNRARSFTMSVWVKALNLNGKVFAHAQSLMYNATGTFGVLLNNGILELEARAWVDGGQCDGIVKTVTKHTMTVGEWAFLTVAVDDVAQTIKLYKNGELAGTGKLDKTDRNTIAHGIGLLADECAFVVGSAKFSCDIDEVQLWNKTQTVEEIKSAISGKYEGNAIPTELLAYYKFDSNTGNTIQNLGKGGEALASVEEGTLEVHNEPPYWGAEVYTHHPIQAAYVEGHTNPSYTLTYNGTADNGTFNITDKDGKKIESGSSIVQFSLLKIVATPASGYYVKAIKVNNKAIEGADFIFTEASTVVVEFSNTTTATYTAVEGGNVELFINDATTATPFGSEFVLGSKVTLKVTVAEGHEFTSLKVNGEVKSLTAENTYVINNVTAPLAVEAVFAKKTFAVNYGQSANGKIAVLDGAIAVTSGAQVSYGTELTITLTPNAGANLKTFTVNGTDRKNDLVGGKTLSVTVTGTMTIAATFEVPTYVITYNNFPANGRVEVFEGYDFNPVATGASLANKTELTVLMTPKSGCTFKSVKVNNVLVSQDDVVVEAGIATFWPIIDNADVTIDAEFINPSNINEQNANSLSIRYDDAAQLLLLSEQAKIAIIYDLAGNKVQSAAISDRINVSTLSNGCYLVKVATANGSKTMKFIKR